MHYQFTSFNKRFYAFIFRMQNLLKELWLSSSGAKNKCYGLESKEQDSSSTCGSTRVKCNSLRPTKKKQVDSNSFSHLLFFWSY